MRVYKVNKIKNYVFDSLDEVPSDVMKRLKKDRDSATVGDWIETDDGAYVEVLRRGEMKKAKGKKRIVSYIGTCTGTYIVGGVIDSSKRVNIYSFGGEKTVDERLIQRTHLTSGEEIFVTLIAQGLPIQDAYTQAFPTNNKQYANMRAGRLVKTERIKEAMKKELRPILKKLDIDEEYILSGIKCSADNAEKEDVRLRALFKLSDILDMEDKNQPKVTQLTGIQFQGFTDEDIDKAERPKEISSV